MLAFQWRSGCSEFTGLILYPLGYVYVYMQELQDENIFMLFEGC